MATTLSTCSWSSARWTDGAAVVEEVLDLGRRVRRVQPDGDGPHGDGGEVEDDPLGAVLGVDRHPVARFDAERQQSVGGVDDLVPRPRPTLAIWTGTLVRASRTDLRCATSVS